MRKSRLFLLGLVVLVSCPDNHQDRDAGTTDDSDSEADRDAGTDSSEELPLALPYGDGLVEECVAMSVCGGGALTECLSLYLADDDGFSIESIILKSLFLARRGCIASAEGCDDVQACVEDAEANLLTTLGTEPCGGYPELRCEDDRIIWCLESDEDADPTDSIYDLSLLGKVCNDAGTDAIDKEKTPCDESDYPNGAICNDSLVQVCNEGEVLSFDCRHVDPDFVCTLKEGDQAVCTMPAPEAACDGLTANLYDSRSRCNGDVAELCVSGRFIEADCSAFGAGCVAGEDVGSVSCDLSL